jgi:hypothetical protein
VQYVPVKFMLMVHVELQDSELYVLLASVRAQVELTIGCVGLELMMRRTDDVPSMEFSVRFWPDRRGVLNRGLSWCLRPSVAMQRIL